MSRMVSSDTPVQLVSSFDHLVTQWISTVNVSLGSLRNSSQVHTFGSSTSPTIEKVQSLSGTLGVGPADSTGKSLTTCWPGGTRELLATSRRLPLKPREMNATLSVSSSDRAHAVVFGVVLDLGKPQCLHQWRNVHAEPAAKALLETVPAADRVLRGATPSFHSARGGRLLLIRAPQRHPVAMLLEHRVQIIKAAQVIPELGLSHCAYQCWRIQGFVSVH